MVSIGGQYTALRVLARIVDIGAAMGFVPSSAEADNVPVQALADLADNGVFRPDAQGRTTTEVVDRLLGQLHARRTASMAPGEPTAVTATTRNRNNLALLSSVLLPGSGDGPFEASFDPAPVGFRARRGRMRRFLSVARETQAAGGSSSKQRPSVTLPAALVDGRLPALGFGRECGGRASFQVTHWKGNPYYYLPGGQAFGAVFLTPVVAMHVGACDEPAPRELTGLAPEEELVIAFPPTRVAKEHASRGQLESHCLRWDEAGRTWSTEGCRVVASTLASALVRASATDGLEVEITCSCNRTGTFTATVASLSNGEAATAYVYDRDYPIIDNGSPDTADGDEGAAPLPGAAQAAALFLVFLAAAHAVAFLVALILYSRWGQARLLGKHAALLLQSQGAKRLLAVLVDAEAAKKRRWSITAAATTTTTTVTPTGGGARSQAFKNPIAEKMRAYDPHGCNTAAVVPRQQQGQEQGQGQEEDAGAKARRALYEAEQLYVAAQDRQRLFHSMEKGPTAQRFLAEVAEQEIGALLTSILLRQQQGPAEGEQAEEQPHATTPAQQAPHPATTLHMTVRPLAPGSAAANASAAAAGEVATAAAAGGAPAAATTAAGRPTPAATVQASLRASRQRQLDLQRTVLFVVKHLVLLLVCAGRFEAPTARFAGWALRDCADAGMGDLLRPGSVCVQPQQFIFRNLIQFVLLLPLLLLLYVLLPGACVTH